MNDSTSTGGVNLIFNDKTASYGTWHNVFINAWKENPDLSTINQTEKIMKDFASSQPTGIGLFSIIKQKATIPKSEVRSMMAKVFKNTKVIGSVSIVEGKGFRAAAVLGFLSSLTLLARHPFPHKAFDSVNEASSWFFETANNQGIKTNYTANQLERAIFDFITRTSQIQ